MKLYIITTAAPPKLDGIGHYTAILAKTIHEQDPSVEVTVFAPDGLGKYDPIDGKPVRTDFRVDDISTWNRFTAILRDEKPDWVFLQYQPYSYGKWGRNPVLPKVLKEARGSVPGLRLAVMIHEAFTPPAFDWSIASMKRVVFATWQKQQFRDLVRMSDVVFFSTEGWIQHFASWFPGKTISTLGVGSSIPLVPVAGGKSGAKKRLKIPEDHLVIGLFGTAHSSRMNEITAYAIDAVRKAGKKPFLLYIGPDPTKYAATVPPDVPSLLEGPFPEEEVSQRMQAIDIFLCVFIDGVAARRTSFITALQHGLAIVGSIGVNTDSWIARSDAFQGVVLNADTTLSTTDDTFATRFSDAVQTVAADDVLRAELGEKARSLFDERFQWNRIAGTVLQKLTDGK